MLRISTALVLSLLAVTGMTAAQVPIHLWPKGAPDGSGAEGPERDTTTAKDALVAGRSVVRLGNVSDPTITFYPAAGNRNSGTTVVVFPGGGYRILALDLEGTEVCTWLNSIGVNAVLLKYRVPQRPNVPRYEAPLQDAQRALGVVRHQASQWKTNPHRIGVLGFSAGGHLAALISTAEDKRNYPRVDAADEVSAKPDFTILVYPAYLTADDDRTKLAPELTVSANTPPSFLVQAQDDPVHVENSLVYYRALTDAKVPAELLIFPSGGHGYGLRRTEQIVTTWPVLAEQWLRSRGLLAPQ
jgi:acetyl esterase/lipase